MTYSTIMVHLDGARPNRAVLDAAATLASSFGAKVIGIAACQPVRLGTPDGYMDGTYAVLEREIVDDELARTKIEFNDHLALRPHVLEWRSISTQVNVAHVVAAHARCADLLITGTIGRASDASTHADGGNLVMHAGRPVLVVPDANVTADFRTIVVAWADTPECRRVIVDSLPMLHRADRVIVAEVSADPVAAGTGMLDVLNWLRRHGIEGDRVNARIKRSASESIAAIADETGADLLVAGAYGHSRIREWAFGGVTRDLLMHGHRCTLMSH